MLPMSRLLRFTHDNQISAKVSARALLSHMPQTIWFFSSTFAIWIGRRDKNHHCRCSHGCSARTLILACENINAIRSISSSDSISNATYVRIAMGKCARPRRSQCGWGNSSRHVVYWLPLSVTYFTHTHKKGRKMNALWFTLHIKNELNWKNG